MKTLGVARTVLLIAETLAWGVYFAGVGIAAGLALGGDCWIPCGTVGFLLGVCCGAFHIKKKMARITKELYPDPARPGTLSDCKWLPGKDGNWILWYEYGGVADALTDCKK